MSDYSFIHHLENLRKRIIFVLVFFIAALMISLVFVGNVYDFLIIPVHGKLTVLGPGDVVQIYLMIAGIAALAITTPFLLWQLWLFVGPGLLPKERAYALRLIGPVTLMFLLGICFGYFAVFPNIFYFLKKLAIIHFHFMLTATEYFSFMVNIVLPFGLLFELPIAVMFLTRIGIITPQWMRKVRRFAYFACIVLGTLISPPELISHLSVTVPMILMYELSIGISAFAYKRKMAAEAWWREDGVSQTREPESAQTVEPEPAQIAVQESTPTTVQVTQHKGVKVSSGDGSLEVSARLREQMASPPVLPRRPGIHVDERE